MDDLSELGVLVERAGRGDPAAWEDLFRRAYPRLLAYATRRLANPEDARDAVSETFARAVRGIDRFRSTGGGFDAWLYGILRHVVLDAQRVSGRRRTGELTDFADNVPGPVEQLLGADEAAGVRLAFSRLSPADQELIELRVVGGLSSEEAAVVLGKRPGTVRMAQARALARLRVLLEKAGVNGG